MDRLRGKRKIKRDGWVRQLAIDMPQLTQSEIAKRFGLEQSTVSRILKKATPMLAVLHPYPDDKKEIR